LTGRSILYVSYDGALEALGDSQVVTYLERLAVRHDITLLSFEKAPDLADAERVSRLRRRLAAADIRWRPLRYHSRPPVLSTAWDVMRGVMTAVREARRDRARVIHARSYVAALVALAVCRVVGARFVFDMRGFWPDEKVDAGRWRRGSALYNLAKRCERLFLESADAVVSLTHAGVDALRRLGVVRADAVVEVIPTCADLRRFSPGPRDPALAARLAVGDGPVVGCVGSLSLWYLRHTMLRYLGELTQTFGRLTVLIVTQEDHEALRCEAIAAGVPAGRLRITRAAFAEMPEHLRLMQAGLFFIAPTFAKQASAATKLAEFLGTGVPVIINDGVGDSGRIVREGRAGIVLPDTTPQTLSASLRAVAALLDDREVRARCRATAERWFDLDAGVERYARIYARLGVTPRSRPEPAAGGHELLRP
jgi:glycosyltransferase involved in cell wall biosynthesis